MENPTRWTTPEVFQIQNIYKTGFHIQRENLQINPVSDDDRVLWYLDGFMVASLEL